MLEKNSDHSDKSQGSGSDLKSIEESCSVPNWEERLTAARAQREQALARHLEAKKERAAKDAAAGPAAADTAEAETDTGAAVAVPAAQVAGPDAQAEAPGGLTAVADRLGRSLLIAMACFAGLGFGLAIGLGMVFGLGALQSTAPVDPVVEDTETPTEEAAGMYAQPDPVVTATLPAPTSDPAPVPVAQIAIRPPLEAQPDLRTPAPVTEVPAEVALAAPEEGVLSLVAWLPLQPVVASAEPSDAVVLPLSAPDVLPGSEWKLADKLAAAGMNLEVFDLRVYAPDAVPNSRLESSLLRLAGTGLSVENLQRVDFAVSTGHIRYYNPEDSEAAQALAAELDIEARDFTEEQSGPVGLIEVWLAGAPKQELADELVDRWGGTYLFGRLRDQLVRD